MTTLVYFERIRSHAKGVAIMDRDLYEHPLMIETLEVIAEEQRFQLVTESELELCFQTLHRSLDEP